MSTQPSALAFGARGLIKDKQTEEKSLVSDFTSRCRCGATSKGC
jgi:hypothetical protein